MKKVIIIGGGFAGIAAVNVLRKYSNQIEVTLIDQKQDCDFLPLLPDIISNRIERKFLIYNFQNNAAKLKVKFVNASVDSVCLKAGKVSWAGNDLAYDYLILATGSETNFYNDLYLQKQAVKLDNSDDAVKILSDLNSQKYDNFVIFGGGYTGIEIATNIWRYFFKRKLLVKPIFIVEKNNQILGRLPQWMQKYTLFNLKKMGIEIISQAELELVTVDAIKLNNGKIIPKAQLVWAAGVKISELIKNIGLKTAVQGRVVVDEYLRINHNCFCAGDAAYIEINGQPLRMGVQFAIAQGCLAAKNIILSIKGKKLKKYYPLDLGYIIPMGNGSACGMVLGLKVRGGMAVFLHYMMCIFRSLSVRNRLGIVGDLFKNK